jgi:hypothetical protein
MGKYTGRSSLALKPTSTDEVSQILAYCSLRRLALVPQGGNTGLVGGSVPVFDEVVLNMSAMNRIVSFDEVRKHASYQVCSSRVHVCSVLCLGPAGPVFDEVVLNMSAMNKIMPFDKVRQHASYPTLPYVLMTTSRLLSVVLVTGIACVEMQSWATCQL